MIDETKEDIRNAVASIRDELKGIDCDYAEEAEFNLLEIEAAIDPSNTAIRPLTIYRLLRGESDLAGKANWGRRDFEIARKIMCLDEFLRAVLIAEEAYVQASRKASSAASAYAEMQRKLRVAIGQGLPNKSLEEIDG